MNLYWILYASLHHIPYHNMKIDLFHLIAYFRFPFHSYTLALYLYVSFSIPQARSSTLKVALCDKKKNFILCISCQQETTKNALHIMNYNGSSVEIPKNDR